MTESTPPSVDAQTRLLRELREILERARREQNSDKKQREIEQAIELINSELNG
jgi:DNA topoisomerase VI subunit B